MPNVRRRRRPGGGQQAAVPRDVRPAFQQCQVRKKSRKAPFNPRFLGDGRRAPFNNHKGSEQGGREGLFHWCDSKREPKTWHCFKRLGASFTRGRGALTPYLLESELESSMMKPCNDLLSRHFIYSYSLSKHPVRRHRQLHAPL